jgi:hypothetical protein
VRRDALIIKHFIESWNNEDDYYVRKRLTHKNLSFVVALRNEWFFLIHACIIVMMLSNLSNSQIDSSVNWYHTKNEEIIHAHKKFRDCATFNVPKAILTQSIVRNKSVSCAPIIITIYIFFLRYRLCTIVSIYYTLRISLRNRGLSAEIFHSLLLHALFFCCYYLYMCTWMHEEKPEFMWKKFNSSNL